MSAGADNSDVAGALEGETVDGTPLPRSFLVEASGPATIVRDHGDITERTEGTVEISHRIETLEEFGEFWALRSKRHPERTAVNKLLNAQDEGMGARYDQVGEWDVVIDGHVQAFFGVAEAIVGFHGDIEDFDAPNQTIPRSGLEQHRPRRRYARRRLRPGSDLVRPLGARCTARRDRGQAREPGRSRERRRGTA